MKVFLVLLFLISLTVGQRRCRLYQDPKPYFRCHFGDDWLNDQKSLETICLKEAQEKCIFLETEQNCEIFIGKRLSDIRSEITNDEKCIEKVNLFFWIRNPDLKKNNFEFQDNANLCHLCFGPNVKTSISYSLKRQCTDSKLNFEASNCSLLLSE